jgi:hypothetical protein
VLLKSLERPATEAGLAYGRWVFDVQCGEDALRRLVREAEYHRKQMAKKPTKRRADLLATSERSAGRYRDALARAVPQLEQAKAAVTDPEERRVAEAWAAGWGPERDAFDALRRGVEIKDERHVGAAGSPVVTRVQLIGVETD